MRYFASALLCPEHSTHLGHRQALASGAAGLQESAPADRHLGYRLHLPLLLRPAGDSCLQRSIYGVGPILRLNPQGLDLAWNYWWVVSWIFLALALVHYAIPWPFFYRYMLLCR